MSSPWDSDSDSLETSSTCSDSLFDEEDVNYRIKPFWPKYRSLFQSRGYELDTVRDARAYYRRFEKSSADFLFHYSISSVLCSEEGSPTDNDLCPDAGLVSAPFLLADGPLNMLQPDNLFRGVRTCDGKRFVAKAVHSASRECEVVKLLSSPPLSHEPMNHTIRTLNCSFGGLCADR